MSNQNCMSKHKDHRKHVFFATYTRCPTHSGTSETTNAKAEEHCCGARYSQVGIGCQIVSEKGWNHGPRHLMMAWFCKAKGGEDTVHTAATIGTRALESGKKTSFPAMAICPLEYYIFPPTSMAERNPGLFKLFCLTIPFHTDHIAISTQYYWHWPKSHSQKCLEGMWEWPSSSSRRNTKPRSTSEKDG